MKKLCILFIYIVGVTACTPMLSNRFLNGFWYVQQDTSVKYTFTGKNTLYIDNEIEGEMYTYHLNGDTMIFMPQLDNEVYGDSACADTMILKPINHDTLIATYVGLDFKLVRIKTEIN